MGNNFYKIKTYNPKILLSLTPEIMFSSSFPDILLLKNTQLNGIYFPRKTFGKLLILQHGKNDFELINL